LGFARCELAGGQGGSTLAESTDGLVNEAEELNSTMTILGATNLRLVDEMGPFYNP
jgi:hypothetical protein